MSSRNRIFKIVAFFVALALIAQLFPRPANRFVPGVQSVQAATGPIGEMMGPALPQVLSMSKAAFSQAATNHAEPEALAQPISISRMQSSYQAGANVVVTYTVRNNLLPASQPDIPVGATVTDTLDAIAAFDTEHDPNTIRNLIVSNSLTPEATFVSATAPPDREGETFVWNLGDVPPLGSVSFSVELAVPGAVADLTELDTGATAWGTAYGRPHSASTTPAFLLTDELASWLVCTMDANCDDPYIVKKAGELGNDPTATFEFVRGLGFESYQGSLRGARGALWSQAGNAADQTSLLIALLRASGIPARYRFGTLEDVQAQQLLESMFPEVTGVIGHIPDDYDQPLADPVHDPVLLDETRDHWWAEAYLPGVGWTSLDPSFASAQPGDVFVTTPDPVLLTELPDSLRHKVSIQVKVEDYNPLYLGVIPGLDYTDILSMTFRTVELVGEPVTLAHLVTTEGLGGMAFSSITHTYMPYLVVGTEETTYEGEPFQELLSSFPLGSNPLTAEWLIFEMRDPEGNVERYEREIFDSIGVAARQAGGTVDLGAQARGTAPAVSDMSNYTTLFAPSFIPDEVITDDYQQMVTAVSEGEQALDDLDVILADGNVTPDEYDALFEIRYALNHLARVSQRTHLFQFAATSDIAVENLGQTMLVKPYYISPRIHTVSWETDVVSGTQTVTFDLRRNDIRALAYPGQTVEGWQAFNIAYGLVEFSLESEILQSLAPDEPVISVSNILAEAKALGIPLVMITPANLEDLEPLAISDEAKARITDALTASASKFVLVPAESVTIGGETTIGWIQSDIITGETIDVQESGLHVVSVEYAILITSSIQEIGFALAGFGQGVAGFTFVYLGTLLGNLPGDLAYAKAAALQEATQWAEDMAEQLSEQFDHKWADAFVGGAGAEGSGSVSAGGASQGFGEFEVKVGGFSQGAAFAANAVASSDPPLPTALLARPQPATDPQPAVGLVAANATLAGTAVNAAVTLDTFAADGNMIANWTSSAQHGLLFNQLNATNASLYAQDGTLLQSGDVAAQSLDEIARATTSSSTAHYEATGPESTTFYAPALSGLAAGSNWTPYTLEISPTQAISLTLTDALVTVSGYTYTGTLTLATDDILTLSGSGPTVAPSFANTATLAAQNAQMSLGPASGTLTIGGQAVDASNGVALADFSGDISITETTASLDTLTLNGSAAFFALALPPGTSATTPGAPAIFQADISANFNDTFTVTVTAVSGWETAVDGAGLITVIPPLGTSPDSYTVLVTAQSGAYPDLIVSAVHTVTVNPMQGVAVALHSDPSFTIPCGDIAPDAPDPDVTNNGQMQLPDAAFTIAVTNTSTVSHAFSVDVSGLAADWLILNGQEGQNSTTITLPAGGVGVIGLYISPAGAALPPVGTNYPFDVTATATDNPAVVATDNDLFTVPSVPFSYLSTIPRTLYTTANTTSTFEIRLENVGNAAGSFSLTATPPDGWTVSNLQSPIALNAGETDIQEVTLDVPSATLGQVYHVLLRSPVPGSVYTQISTLRVWIVTANSQPIFEAGYRAGSDCSLDGDGLAAALEALGLAINDLEQSCDEGDCDLSLRDQAVAAAESAAAYARLASPLLTADNTLRAIAADLSTHTADVDIEADIVALGAAAADLETEMCEAAEHAPAARFTPYMQASLPGQTVTYTLDVENQGSLSTTYSITLSLPTGTSTFSETIDPGDTFTTPVSVATTTVALHELQADVVAVGQDVTLSTIADSASAHINVVNSFVQVTAVHADPAFIETGANSSNLSVDVANVANVTREANARTTILAPTSSISWTNDISLTVLVGAPRTYELGSVDTSGWAEGVYTITVDLLDDADALIPDGSGYGYLSIGQALAASHAVEPDIVAPGTVTVTTIVTTEILVDSIGGGGSGLLSHGLTSHTGIGTESADPLPAPTLTYPLSPVAGPPVDAAVGPSADRANDLHSIPLSLQTTDSGIQSVSIGGVFTRTEENEAAVLYTGTWNSGTHNRASGNGYTRADSAGEVATFTFYGNWVNVGFLGNINSGHAEVFIDGASQGTLDLYRRELTAISFVYDNLVTATHTISVTALDTKNTYASNDYVLLDYFDAWTSAALGDGTFEQDDARVLLSAGWGTLSDLPAASGGSYVRDELGTAWFPFSGDSFSFHTVLRADNGWARLYVDGQYLTSIQGYNRTLVTETLSYQGFGPGPHILQVSTYRANSTVDAFTTPGTAPFNDPDPVGSYTRYEEDHPAWLYNGVPFTQTAQTWTRINNNAADRSSDDQVIGSDTAADVAQITVSGEWINLGFGADSNSGEAEIFLNGISQGTIDLYRRESGVVNKVFSGLASTTHTISVTVSGGGDVWIDYLDVWDGTALPNGTYKDYPNDGYYRSGGWGYATFPQDHWYSTAGGTLWFPFSGETVSYSYLGNTDSGRVRIYVDEAYQGLFDLYSSPAATQTISFDNLGTGAHILRIDSYRDRATFDAFTIPGASPYYSPTVETGIIRYEEDDPLWLYNDMPYTQTATTWTRNNGNLSDLASDDQMIGSSTADDVAQITVSGEWINLGFAAYSGSGQAEIFLDGVSQGAIDLYRHDYSVVSHFFTGLSTGTHTISVTVVGDGDVWIDYLDVWNGTAEPYGTFSHPDEGFYFGKDWAYATNPVAHWYHNFRETWFLNAGIAWFPFTGDSVSYNYLADTDKGKVKIYLDDQYQGVFDLYNSTAVTKTLSFDGLGTGAHMLRLETYRGRATIHSFETPGASPFYTPTVPTGVIRYEEDDPVLRYNGLPYTQTVSTWNISNSPSYGSDAYYAGSSTVSDSVSLEFEGTWFGVGFLTHDYGGQADIYLDGNWQRTVDLYTNEPDTASYYFDNLLAGTHTVSVTVLSTAHPNSRGNRVRFDYFDVWDGTDMLEGTFEESNERLIYSGGWWRNQSSGAASGGTYARDDNSNNSTVWFPFTGESVTYQALAHSQAHEVIVKIDGVTQDLVDIYNDATMTRTFSFDGLADGPHVMEVRAYRWDTTVDAFITPGSAPWYTPSVPNGIIRYEEDDPALLYNGYPFTQTVYTWSPDEYAYWVSSNGWVHRTGTAGNWVSLDFSGTWVGAGFSQSTGEARVHIDGSPVVTLDLSLEPYVTNVYFDDLISGSHTISVERVSGAIYFDFFDTWDGSDMGDGWFEAKLNDHRGPYHYNTLSRWYTRSPNNDQRIQYARDADVLARTFMSYPTYLWFTFTGDDLMFLPFQSNGGSAEVFIDGVSQGVVDLTPEYSTQPYAIHFQDLGEGPHVAHVDTSNAFVDAFQVDPPNALPYTPQVEWHDTAPTLMTTIAIGDLEGDGVVELVAPGNDGITYVYRGDGADAGGGTPLIWSTSVISKAAEPALVDLDDDGDSEIVISGQHGTYAFHHDGTTYWYTDSIKSYDGTYGWGGPTIGNLDLEPGPEIVLAASNDALYVLDHDGQVLFEDPIGIRPTVPVLADLTGDGMLDIIVAQGHTLKVYDYHNGGTLHWTYTLTRTTSRSGSFGAPAVADIDGKQPGGDDGPEVVINWGHRIEVLDADGSLLQSYYTGSDAHYCPSHIAIADVDGDGEIEIITASAISYAGFLVRAHNMMVLNADGTLLWEQELADSSASASGVATQDLDGDGVWEILWNGYQDGLMILRGSDGTRLFNEPATKSGTILDYPTLGDVDGDGDAEVVAGGSDGIFVIGHDELWTMSRPVWNQHNYHITNINDDWSAPTNEPNSWEIHNTYRTQTPDRAPTPSYRVDLTYTAGITAVTVLTSTASVTLTASPPDYGWTYRHEWYNPIITTTFDSLLADVRPGEARLVAEGTYVAYRLPSGYNYLTLPPLYVSAPHIVAVDPVSQTAPLGGTAVYTITLSNPAASSDVYTLSVAGLSTDWLTHVPTVTVPADGEVTMPLSVTVPADAAPASLAFSVNAANGAGGTDLAAAALGAFDALDLALEPASIATLGLSGVFSLTLTNLDDAPQTVDLVAAGLATVDLPASVVVPGNTAASLAITATATANGPYPFTVAGTNSETGASDQDHALLDIHGRRGVDLSLSPTSGVGGPGTDVLYELAVSNLGNVPDTYDLAVAVPAGWSYRLEANGSEVSSLSLPPHLFNTVDLDLLVTPSTSATPGAYSLSATAQSQGNPGVSAVATATLEVLSRGVQVDIQPGSTVMDPTGTGTWHVTVTNTGSVADTYVLTATGIVALAGQFTPDNTVSLNPGQFQTVQLAANNLQFVLPQTYEFGVWAESQADSRIHSEDRAEVTFTGYEAVEAAWLPADQTVTDTLSAAYMLVVTNTGNVATTYQLGLDSLLLSGDLFIDELIIPPHMAAGILATVQAPAEGTYTLDGAAVSAGGNVSASVVATLTVVYPNQAPSAAAGMDQATDEGSPLSFSGSANDLDGDPLTIHWDLGDGATASGALTPTHTYVEDGDYRVTLTVTDTTGASASDSLTVTVSNVAPAVDAGPDQAANTWQPLSFSGAFTDPGLLDVHSIEWAFGDGGVVSDTLTPTHTYTQSGAFTVTLTITDDDGGVGEDDLYVTVQAVPLTVYAGPDQAAQEGAPIDLTGAFSDTAHLPPHTTLWAFGDGKRASGTLTPTHIYADDGVYTVTLTITNSNGVVGQDSLIATVNNVAPDVDAGPDQVADVGQSVSFTGAYTDPGRLDTHIILWTFGDESTASDTLTPTHEYAVFGAYTVTLTVTDDDGGQRSDTLRVIVNTSGYLVHLPIVLRSVSIETR